MAVASAIASIPNDDVVTKTTCDSSRLKKNTHNIHEVHEETTSLSKEDREIWRRKKKEAWMQSPSSPTNTWGGCSQKSIPTVSVAASADATIAARSVAIATHLTMAMTTVVVYVVVLSPNTPTQLPECSYSHLLTVAASELLMQVACGYIWAQHPCEWWPL